MRIIGALDHIANRGEQRERGDLWIIVFAVITLVSELDYNAEGCGLVTSSTPQLNKLQRWLKLIENVSISFLLTSKACLSAVSFFPLVVAVPIVILTTPFTVTRLLMSTRTIRPTWCCSMELY